MSSFLILVNKNYKIFHNNRLYSTSNFHKILIANRGEIACRIIKTAKKLGIKTVSVFSEADSKSKHVELSDESIYIGPTAAKESYLNMSRLIEAAKLTKSTAIHPGYGFLSENAEFVKLLEENNISFIGPPAEVIKKMGDKLESKRIATTAGVHTIPGFDGIIQNEEHCLKIAEDIGYPVMIKASAGGGGKGMRIAENCSQIKEGYRLSTQEALSSFGDGRILIEKFIGNPRHIEIQVLADKHGNVVHLGERECSIQRRNQKIIEEAPSSFLDQNLREKMTNEAVTLCKQLKYSSAGTVEFLVDENRNHYFLEMNTRLQVEHPVTEYVTNVDLIEEMIRIAAGEKLRFTQNDIQIRGWSLESRIYAEDPYKSFGTPSVGKIHKYFEPDYLTDVRFDSGVKEGSDINVYYDPLICKLITFGANRSKAVEKHIQALDSFVIHGVTTNIPLLRDILIEPNFQLGNLNTNYLNTTYPNGFPGAHLSKKEKDQLIAMTLVIHEISSRQSLKNIPFVVTLNTDKYNVTVNKTESKFNAVINDTKYVIEGNMNISSPLISVKINDEHCIFQLLSKDGIGNFQLMYHGTIFNLNVTREHVAKYLQFVNSKQKIETVKIVKAPMPGLIKSILCKKGQSVAEGEELCVIEAMKMQNCIVSPINGKIKNVHVKENDVVSELDSIIEFE